jgi:ABC-2 type transport system ATP-binding protein
MPDAIVIKHLSKSFGPKRAVDDVSLAIPTGALCGVIGPNGAGKTTTIRMIMSIIFPDSGELSVLGKSSAVESKDRIGYLPEERGVYRKMRVGTFLQFMARLKGVDAAAARRKVQDWLARVELGDVARKRCEELSKGMQQKVQFIAAVIHEPDLLILDEVFSGLDPVNRILMRRLIDEQHRAGRTIMFSTHAMYEAEQLCDRVFMIHRGRKVLDGTLAEITSRFDPHTIIAEPVAPSAGGHPDPEGVLYAVPGVDGIQRQRDALVIKVDQRESAPQVLARVAAAAPMRRVELKRVTLEEVFINVVTAGGQAPLEDADLASLHGDAGNGALAATAQEAARE